MKFHNIYPRIGCKGLHMKVSNKKLIELVQKERIVTSSEVAREFNISWNTAEKYLMELLLEKKLQRIKKEGVTLWTL